MFTKLLFTLIILSISNSLKLKKNINISIKSAITTTNDLSYMPKMQYNTHESSKIISKKSNIVNSLQNSQVLTVMSTIFLICDTANAKDGQYGILEGKWAGMLHPIALIGLYVISISAAYFGLRWRSSRVLGKLIKEYNTSNNSEESIEELKSKQKQLAEGDPKNKHVILGSILLGSGTALAFEGGLSTYWRVGELFPDTHLFAGMALVMIWAISYSLSPFMAKGKDWARNAHLTLNLVGIAIYTWQILTGWEIMVNVFNEVPGW